ncbi:MAG: OmpA family protein [Bacteroidales bacterium]|jgi:chemotaxis protein MotB|nr:OmpA family protein [Bacteroidales bacterium]
MKRNVIILAAISVLLLSGCVSKKEFADMESRYKKASKALSDCQEENQGKDKKNKTLTADYETLNANYTAMQNSNKDLEQQNKDLKSYNNELKSQIDTANKRLQEAMSNKGADMKRMSDELFAARQELSQKTEDLNAKQEELSRLQLKFSEKDEMLDKLQKALSEKEEELASIERKISSALLGFADKGLSVVTKDGKVYVSMEEKLLFSSGSWEINSEGAAALREISKVLANNPDINVMVEGHTDNVPLKGKNQIKDNWDLSVMRATSVTKILLENNKVSSERVIPSGRGEYLPLMDNKTAESRAKNRRTEIILTPKVDELMKIIGK